MDIFDGRGKSEESRLAFEDLSVHAASQKCGAGRKQLGALKCPILDVDREEDHTGDCDCRPDTEGGRGQSAV
jgi:hypothetical protein